MKFKFKFYKIIYKNFNNLEEIRPTCSSVNDTQDERIIASYIDETISYFDDNDYKNIINSLKSNEYEISLDIQSWFVDVIGDNIYIFFAFDTENKEYQVNLTRETMLKLFEKWMLFIEKKPYLDYEEIIEIE